MYMYVFFKEFHSFSSSIRALMDFELTVVHGVREGPSFCLSFKRSNILMFTIYTDVNVCLVTWLIEAH